ncbi:MAG: hypothetical protein ACK58U_21495 [Rubrivivax sp.]|jgi:hypothetical protein
MAKNTDGRWEIDNQLLHDLLTYGDGAQRLTGLNPCWSIGHGFPIVKGIVSWLTMRALKIERLPWMTDWPFSSIHSDRKGLEQAVAYLRDNPGEVKAACDELCAIHAHTQSFYPQSTLRLGRGYKNDADRSLRFGDYATVVKQHALAAQYLGEPDIVVPQDVITSWGRHWSYTGCLVGVKVDIPTSEILCSAETLAPRPGQIGRHALEPGEFLVLNRNWDRLTRFPAASVVSINGFNVPGAQERRGGSRHTQEGDPTDAQGFGLSGKRSGLACLAAAL